jgi:putative transposase
VKFDPLKHNRRSIRVPSYDYQRAGAYFITVVAQDRQCLFAGIMENEAVLTKAGAMVLDVWQALPAYYAGVEVDAFVLMPNHVHGIVVLTEMENLLTKGGEGAVGPGQAHSPLRYEDRSRSRLAPTGESNAIPGSRGRLSLPDVVHRFKTMTTTRYIASVHQDGWPSFRKRPWQRNYYEEVIRSEERWNEVRQYIADNPRRWEEDAENPDI